MLRRAEHVGDRPALDDTAGVHDDDVVTHLGHDAQVVRDQQDRHPALVAKVEQQVEDLLLDRHVERGRRLVRDQELGVAGERDRDHHPLAHTARHLMRVVTRAARRLGDAHELEHLDRARMRRLRPHALMRAHGLGDLVGDRVDRVQRRHRLLEDHRDLVAADRLHRALVKRRQLAAVEGDPAVVRDVTRLVDEPHHRQRSDRLAAAGLADDAERGAGLQLEVDPVDRADRTAVRVEPRPQVLDPQQRLGHPWSGAPIAMCRSSAATIVARSRVCRALSSSSCSPAMRSRPPTRP